MTPTVQQPCRHGLTPACFRQEPTWAKSAFALRLLHSILPPELSKKLPLILRRALIAPGVTIPAGIDPATLPPGTLITQDTDFPPGWGPGDPLPPEAIPPPAIPAIDAPLAPPHLTATPGADTPPTTTKTNPPPGDNWEARFDNTHWERYFLGSQPNWDGSKWVISSNDSVDITVIGTWHAAYRPTKIRVTFDPAASTLQWLNLMDSDHNPIAYLEPYTNLAEVDITFTTFDILHLSFFDNNDGINITNIEFLP